MAMQWTPFNAGGGRDFVVGIKVSDESASALGRFVENLRSVGGAADGVARSLGSAGTAANGLMQMLGGAGAVGGALAVGTMAVNMANQQGERHRQAELPFAGAAGLERRWGASALEKVSWMGHMGGMTTPEVLSVAGGMSEDLNSQQGIAAFYRYAQLNKVGLGGQGAAAGISGLMRMGYSGLQAQNVVYAGAGMGGEMMGALPNLLGQARTFGFSDEEAMAFASLVDEVGGDAGTAMSLMSSLAGKGQMGDAFLRKAGVSGRGLGARVAALGSIRDDETARAVGGRSTAFLSSLAARSGRMGALQSEFGGAIASDREMFADYQPSDLVRRGLRRRRDAAIEEQFDIDSARSGWGPVGAFFGQFGDSDKNMGESIMRDVRDAQEAGAREGIRETTRLQIGGG